MCICYIRNNDDNCLYAALFLAYVKKYKKIVLNGVEYLFTDDTIKNNLLIYEDINKISKTLKFYTLILK